MEFSVGDRVMYPNLGNGTIIGVEHQELVDGFKRYYVIEIPGEKLTTYVPIRKTDELGVRHIMSKTKLTHVLETLRGMPRRLPEGFKERQKRIREKLKTGSPTQIAEVVRDLTWHERLAHLTKTDSKLLSQGRDFLANEIAEVTDVEVDDVNEMIDSALKE